jgi:hypothetical protein
MARSRVTNPCWSSRWDVNGHGVSWLKHVGQAFVFQLLKSITATPEIGADCGNLRACETELRPSSWRT